MHQDTQASPKASISLQKKLVKTSVLSSVVAGLVALLLLLGITVYQTMAVQDEIMDEIADMLLVSDLTSHSGSHVDELSEQFEIQYQLNYEQQLLTQSENFDPSLASAIPMSLTQEHFGFSWSNGTLVRVFEMTQDEQSLKMYQPLSVRFNAVLESIVSFFIILIVLWLLQWLILHFLIKKQFMAIRRLSKNISEKTAQDLKPIEQSQPEFEELQPIVNQLNQMLKRLEQSLLAEQRFTSDASHELRSPLSAIHMRLQLLRRKYQNELISKDLEQIQVDVSRGTNVLENLLLLARLDPAGDQSLPRSAVRLKQVIFDVKQALEPFSIEKNIDVSTPVHDIEIQANAELIFTCIRNLVDNAIRYSNAHGNVSIELENLQDQVKICIKNSGDVIPKVTLSRMGERFYRELGNKTQGSGLGLSICKKIIELHHGSIDFNNPDEGGLEVILKLPK